MTTEVKALCIEILVILKQAGESNWGTAFENYIAELEAVDKRYVYKKILAMYTGAGSFNDLVLYPNGILSLDENNKLNALRQKLYEATVQQLYFS